MRHFIIAALVTACVARGGHGRKGNMWWGGAPECAHSCLSSVYSDEATYTTWPGPGHFCTATAASSLSSCLVSSCTATPTAYSSLESLSSSACSAYSSCLSSSDAVMTLTVPTPSWYTGGGGHYPGPWATWTGDGTITVTGCPTGDYYGAYGHGPWGYGDECFWGWGYGWSSLTTVTSTETATVTGTDGSESETVTVATVAMAVSDGETQTSTLGAGASSTETTSAATDGSSTDTETATGTSDESTETTDAGGAASRMGSVGAMGVALGAVIAVAGLL